jgi:hypothetical protein
MSAVDQPKRKRYRLPPVFAKNGYKPPDDIRAMIREHVNWAIITKHIIKMAVGGYRVKNGNGVEYAASPNLDYLKLLLYYAYGQPTQMTSIDDDSKKAMQEFGKFMQELNKPNGHSVTANGVLVEQNK